MAKTGLGCLLIAATILANACARTAEAVPPYPFKLDATRIFVATGAGLVEAGAEPASLVESAPAPLAPNAHALTADDRVALVAVNGVGVALIAPSPDGSAFRIANRPAPEHFAARTVGGAWPRQGGFFVHLYRDPFVSESKISTTPSALLRLDENGTADPVPFPSEKDVQLFALFPSASGSWYAELRREGASRVESRYLRLSDLLDPEPLALDVGRERFESALAPRPLAEAGDSARALEAAVRAMSNGPFLARLRGADGRDLWYSESGGPVDGSQIAAWRSSDGSVIAVDREGRAVRVGASGQAEALSLPLPAAGAAFTAVAAVGPLAVFAWEAGSFPSISAAGVVVVRAR